MVSDYKRQVINTFFVEMFCASSGSPSRGSQASKYPENKNKKLHKTAERYGKEMAKLKERIEKVCTETLPSPSIMDVLPFSTRDIVKQLKKQLGKYLHIENLDDMIIE